MESVPRAVATGLNPRDGRDRQTVTRSLPLSVLTSSQRSTKLLTSAPTLLRLRPRIQTRPLKTIRKWSELMKSFGRVARQFTSAICMVALLATSFAYALGQQNRPKRALTHQDYDSWHSIQSPQISRDGKFIAYAFMAQDGDSEIVVRNLTSGAEWRAPRGYRRS